MMQSRLGIYLALLRDDGELRDRLDVGIDVGVDVLAALPVDSMLRVLIDDYGQERRQLRAARGEPEPSGCAP